MAQRTARGRTFAGVLQAIIAIDAGNELSVLQHTPWLGRLFSASILRQATFT